MVKIKITDFYDEFRPYNESEAKEAVKRLSQNDQFFHILKYFFTDLTKNSFLDLINSVQSIHDFQANIMHPVAQAIIRNTCSGFSFSGLENIKNNENYVFISNHRDIILDAALFLDILLINNIETTEVTFGNNLMQNKLVFDLGKINKMFKVYRKGTPKELLKKTIQLSEYIRYTLLTKKRSVWMAQRGGRTKDGNDKTQTGIIKMLNASGTSCLAENLKDLNIVPLTVSYEYEPNDHLKVKELLNTVDGKYIKEDNEDILSIIDGVEKFKGRIHFHIGEPINDKLNAVKKINARNEQIAKVAEIIDQSIHRNYKLMPNNFIAYDLINNSDSLSQNYTKNEKEAFLNYMDKQLTKAGKKTEKGTELFLNIYANPVINQINLND